MTITIQGNFTKGKEMMKNYRADCSKRITELEKKHRKSSSARPKKEVEELKNLYRSVDVYSVSKVLPVKYKDAIVNGKLLQAFMKKLKGYQIGISVEDRNLYLSYENRISKGELELRDLSTYFEGFPDIPVLSIEGDDL